MEPGWQIDALGAGGYDMAFSFHRKMLRVNLTNRKLSIE